MSEDLKDLYEFCEQKIKELGKLCQDAHSETNVLVNMGSIGTYKEVQEKLKELLQTSTDRKSIFTDQKTFMEAGDQSVDFFNESQYNLYLNLIKEEFNELLDAEKNDDKVEVVDAVLDIITVCVGLLYSIGCDAEGAWNEVVRSNMSKIDPETGKVLKREDGKVLKPASFSPPNLEPFITVDN